MMTPESIRALLAEQSRQEAALERMLRTVVRWAGLIFDTEADPSDMPGELDARANAAEPDSGGWQSGLPDLGRQRSSPVLEPARQSRPAEPASPERATKGGERRAEQLRSRPVRTSESESLPAERPALMGGTGRAPGTNASDGAWTLVPRSEDTAPQAAITQRARMPKVAQQGRRTAPGAVAPATIPPATIAESRTGNPGARNGAPSAPSAAATSSRAIALSIPAQAPGPVSKGSPESRAVRGAVSPSPTEFAVPSRMPAWQREDRAIPARFPEPGVRGRNVAWSKAEPGPIASGMPAPTASSCDAPRHQWRTDGGATDRGWWPQPRMQDPFADSTLEEAMADTLERAARESGIDMS